MIIGELFQIVKNNGREGDASEDDKKGEEPSEQPVVKILSRLRRWLAEPESGDRERLKRNDNFGEGSSSVGAVSNSQPGEAEVTSTPAEVRE